MRWDLLRLRPLNWLVRRKLLPVSAQLLTLAALVSVLVFAWGKVPPKGLPEEALRYPNLGNFLVWVVFWPLVVIVTPILGRVWCTVCPVELLTSLSSASGWDRSLPRPLRNIALMVAGFFLIRTFITAFNLHWYPHTTALYLSVLVGVAVLVGLLFRRRSFCTYVCPVGGLLGLYAKCSILELRRREEGICQECEDKPCLTSKSKLFGRACPNFLSPPNLSDNAPCLLCLQCVQACPYDNFRLSLRRPFKDLVATRGLDFWWTLYLVPLLGNVLHEFGEEWWVTERMAFGPPEALSKWLDLSGPASAIPLSLWLYVLLPLSFLCLPVLLSSLAGERERFWEAMRVCAPAFIPLAAGGHMVKALYKVAKYGGFLRYALRDPWGLETARAIAEGRLPRPGPILRPKVVGAMGVVILLIAWAGGLWAAREMGRRGWLTKRQLVALCLSLSLLALLFLGVAGSLLAG